MQIEIVRHHRGAQDADSDVEIAVRDMRYQAWQHVLHRGPASPADLDEEASTDYRDQSQDETLDHANPKSGEPEQQQRVGSGENNAVEQGNMKQQVQRDGRAQHFSEIAGCDCNLTQKPK